MDHSTLGSEKRGGGCAPRGGAVFWLLVVMGLGAFALCVLVPEWAQYKALEALEQAARHKLDRLERQVEDQQRLLEAMRSDPAVVARFAQRDLRFRRADERVVRVAAPIPAEPREPTFFPEPVSPPRVVEWVTARLPDCDYEAVFCGEDTRTMLLGMSLGLIGLAVCLFGRRSPGA